MYPLTRLPLAMVEDEDGDRTLLGRLFRSRDHCGWGSPCPCSCTRGTPSANYSDLFQQVSLGQSFTVSRTVGAIPVRLNLPALGLAYLMPLNVAFSVWFFFVLGQVQQILLSFTGIRLGTGDVWTSGAGGPMILAYQLSGGMMVFVLFLTWSAASAHSPTLAPGRQNG